MQNNSSEIDTPQIAHVGLGFTAHSDQAASFRNLLNLKSLRFNLRESNLVVETFELKQIKVINLDEGVLHILNSTSPLSCGYI